MGKLAWRAGRRTAALSVLVGVVPAAGATQAQAVRIKELSTGLTSKDHADHSAAGSDGNLRFTEHGYYRTGRVTPRGRRDRALHRHHLRKRIARHHGGPGRDLWFSGSYIGRVTPEGVVTEASQGITPGSGPPGITAGPEDNPWLAEQGGQIGPTIVEPAKPNPPIVVTEPASSVTQTSATLNASVNPSGGTVSDCDFEYGTSEAYGSSAPCSSLPSLGESPVGVSGSLASLSANTTYHVRDNNDATGGATISGTTLSWSGALAVGATTTITYSVQVNDPDTGDQSLVNGVTPGTGGTCATSTSCQTTVPLVTPAAFGCTSPGYLFQNPNGLSTPHTVTGIDLASGTPTPLGNVADDINTVGYNTLDGYFYAWDAATQDVVRINADYSLTHVATGAGTPSTASIMGDFDNAGHLWIANSAGSTHQWAELDYAPGSPTYGQVLASGVYTNPATLGGNADWSWLGGSLYTMETVSANPAGPVPSGQVQPDDPRHD